MYMPTCETGEERDTRAPGWSRARNVLRLGPDALGRLGRGVPRVLRPLRGAAGLGGRVGRLLDGAGEVAHRGVLAGRDDLERRRAVQEVLGGRARQQRRQLVQL